MYFDKISWKYEQSGWIVRWKDASVQNKYISREKDVICFGSRILRNRKCKIELKISQLVHSSINVISNVNLNRLRPQRLT